MLKGKEKEVHLIDFMILVDLNLILKCYKMIIFINLPNVDLLEKVINEKFQPISLISHITNVPTK